MDDKKEYKNKVKSNKERGKEFTKEYLDLSQEKPVYFYGAGAVLINFPVWKAANSELK